MKHCLKKALGLVLALAMLLEGDGLSGFRRQLFDEQKVAFRHPVLLAAGHDDSMLQGEYLPVLVSLS